MAKREAADRARLKQALEKSTSTGHTLVPNWKQSENEQQSILKRGATLRPTGKKFVGRAPTITKAATKATLQQSGVGVKTTEAFGVKPLQLL